MAKELKVIIAFKPIFQTYYDKTFSRSMGIKWLNNFYLLTLGNEAISANFLFGWSSLELMIFF